MTILRKDWAFKYAGSALASNVSNVAGIGSTDHLRHVRVSGSSVYLNYPTNVCGDNGVWIGVVANYPSSTPPAPSDSNAGSWISGYWGRPAVDSVEIMYLTSGASVPCYHYNFVVEFDYLPVGDGAAGSLYVGYQALYVDANHSLPIVSYTMTAWGYTG